MWGGALVARRLRARRRCTTGVSRRSTLASAPRYYCSRNVAQYPIGVVGRRIHHDNRAHFLLLFSRVVCCIASQHMLSQLRLQQYTTPTEFRRNELYFPFFVRLTFPPTASSCTSARCVLQSARAATRCILSSRCQAARGPEGAADDGGQPSGGAPVVPAARRQLDPRSCERVPRPGVFGAVDVVVAVLRSTFS